MTFLIFITSSLGKRKIYLSIMETKQNSFALHYFEKNYGESMISVEYANFIASFLSILPLIVNKYPSIIHAAKHSPSFSVR